MQPPINAAKEKLSALGSETPTKRRGGGDRAQNVKLHTTRVAEHKARLEQEAKKKRHRSYGSQAEVVPIGQIAAEIRAWVVEHLAEMGIDEKSNGKNPNGLIGPYQRLSELTSISGRELSAIANEEKSRGKFVGFELAEIILSALDVEYKLANGEIEVVPNPRWSVLKWVNYMSERGCY
jgi:hypothetical protein